MSGRDRIAHELLKCIFRWQVVRPLTLAQTLGCGLGASAVRSWYAVRNLRRSRNSARYAQSTRLKIAQLAVQYSAVDCIASVDVNGFNWPACIRRRDRATEQGCGCSGHNIVGSWSASPSRGPPTEQSSGG